jgi:hypothetical protein
VKKGRPRCNVRRDDAGGIPDTGAILRDLTQVCAQPIKLTINFTKLTINIVADYSLSA